MNVHRQGTMNYYYVDANLGKWSEIKPLVDHVCQVVAEASQGTYPHLEE